MGKNNCHIVDTFWQTETGGHVMLPLAGVTPTKPGSCSFPFFGIEVRQLETTLLTRNVQVLVFHGVTRAATDCSNASTVGTVDNVRY